MLTTGAIGTVMFAAGLVTCNAAALANNPTSVRIANVNVTDRKTEIGVPKRKPTSVGGSVRGAVQIVVSVPDQRVDVYDGTVRIGSSRISTGKRGYDTPEGIFSVIQKNKHHRSNIYNNAPMPFMQRLTWSGIALHAGNVPNYPASHGCIRMPYGFAKKLWGITNRNAQIVVNRSRRRPKAFEHATLFQPRPRKPVHVAGKISALTIDGLTIDQVSGRDSVVLNTVKAEHFARELRAIYHPNIGARQRAHVRLTQRLLGYLGYGIKRPDGDLGPITRRAIKSFQKAQGMKQTGRPSKKLSTRLYTEVGYRLISMPVSDADAMLTPPAIDAPLRILITRKRSNNNIKRAQQMLEVLGYSVGSADGVIGRNTRAAITAFRTKQGLAEGTGVDGELLEVLTKETGSKTSDDDMNGRLYIRQGYRDIYEAPIAIRNDDALLGTHIFTAMKFEPDRTGTVSWTALSVAERGKRIRVVSKSRRKSKRKSKRAKLGIRVANASAVLDRIEIPENVRKRVEEMLTPGSSLIVSDHGSSHETGEGTDFIVLTK